MPLVVIAAVALCYLPYLSVGWGVFGFLTKGYLAEEGISAGNDLWLLSLWRLVFGEHQGDVVAYVVWPRWCSCSKGSPWPAVLIAPSPPVLATSTCCYSSPCCCCRPIIPGTFWSSRRLSPCVAPRRLGRFDRRAVAVRTTRLGFLHSQNGDQIDSVRRPLAGLGVDGLEGPRSGPQMRGYRNEPFRRSARHSRPLRSAPLSRVGHRRAYRGCSASAGLPLSGSHQPLQSAVHHVSAHL